MPLPTITLRVAPEHHRLFRDIGAAIRTRPELADVLRDVLQAQHDSGVTERNTDVLQPFIERLEITRRFTERIMAFAENINERVKALEQSAESQAAKPRQPRPAASGKRRSPKGGTGEPPP
jgi:hypothetical protein